MVLARASMLDIGISLPGNGEAPAAPVFIDGEKALTLRGEHIAEEFQTLVLEYVQRAATARKPESSGVSSHQ